MSTALARLKGLLAYLLPLPGTASALDSRDSAAPASDAGSPLAPAPASNDPYGKGVPDDVKEFPDTEEELRRKIKELAALIKESKHVVVFTGAGISTSSGIPDFRGPKGVWTLEAMGLPPPPMKDWRTIKPTLTHMAIAKLVETGIVKAVLSQNVDGLHLRSGVPKNQLAEFHGNYSMERCPQCGEEYYRSAEAHNFKFDGKNRETGRMCLKCGGKLRDTIVNFNESLPRSHLRLAAAHSSMADLFIVLGSSITVFPAASFPESHMERGRKAAIVNLQRTHLDSMATIRIGASVDRVMEGVMAELGIEIPPVKDLDAELAAATQRRYAEWGLDG